MNSLKPENALRSMPAQPPADAGTGGCRVCGSPHIRSQLTVREMMFGFGDSFTYFECDACGSLSRAPGDPDLSRYYPPTYYSFARVPPIPLRGRLAFALARSLPDWALSMGRQMRESHALRTIQETRREVLDWLGSTSLRACRILDVGCGSGEKTRRFYEAGFSVEGVDPYFHGSDPDEFPIHRCALGALVGPYDLVLFQHSLEHVSNPMAELEAAFGLLKPVGACVVALPKLPSAAFTKYCENWFALDAPRHYFIPSVNGMKHLARRAGFGSLTVRHEPDEGVVCWSEAYRRGFTRERNTLAGIFTEVELVALQGFAATALRDKQSSQATFILCKSG